MLGVCALDHIVLNCADVERSLAFYQRTLGLPAERVEGWRKGELPFPSVRINEGTLIDLVAAPRDAGGSRTNLAHFCLVTDQANLDGAIKALGEAGVGIETGPVVRS